MQTSHSTSPTIRPVRLGGGSATWGGPGYPIAPWPRRQPEVVVEHALAKTLQPAGDRSCCPDRERSTRSCRAAGSDEKRRPGLAASSHTESSSASFAVRARGFRPARGRERVGYTDSRGGGQAVDPRRERVGDRDESATLAGRELHARANANGRNARLRWRRSGRPGGPTGLQNRSALAAQGWVGPDSWAAR